MGKFFFLFLASVAPSIIYSLPVGNPSSPKIFETGIFSGNKSTVSLRFGMIGDFISDSRMKQYKEGEGIVDQFQFYAGYPSFTLNLYEALDLYSYVGTSRYEAEWRVASPGLLSHIKARSNSGLAVSGGFNLLLYEWPKTFIGMGGCYTKIRLKVDSLKINTENQNQADSKWQGKTWQMNLGLAHIIDFFIPYIGIKYSRFKSFIETPYTLGIAADGSFRNDFKNRNRIGLYLGCSITLRTFFQVQVEGRLFDEEAADLSAEIRF